MQNREIPEQAAVLRLPAHSAMDSSEDFDQPCIIPPAHFNYMIGLGSVEDIKSCPLSDIEKAKKNIEVFAERVFHCRTLFQNDEEIITKFNKEEYPKISLQVNLQDLFDWIVTKDFNKYKCIADFFLLFTPVCLNTNGIFQDPFHAVCSPIYVVTQPEWINFLVGKGADIDLADNIKYAPSVCTQVQLHLLHRTNKVHETLSKLTHVKLLFTHHDSGIPRDLIDCVTSYMGNVNNPIVPKKLSAFIKNEPLQEQGQLQEQDQHILELFDPLYEPPVKLNK